MITNIEGFVIDLDGTVYRGEQAIEGAIDTIHFLKNLGKRVVFLSNRGNISRKMCWEKLHQMGLDVKKEEIILTSTASAAYLKMHYPNSPVWVLGEQGLKDELIETGVTLAKQPTSADWLLITLHENLTYSELNDAFRAVRSGARIIATNADRVLPSEEGESIDVAGMIGAIEASTGQKVEIVMGKPSEWMAQAAFKILGLPPEKCMVIGDSLESDIRLGLQSGMKTAVVLTGSVTREQAEASPIQPDWILTDIRNLLTKEEVEGNGYGRSFR